jgi:magnesium chelatase subunit D
MRTPTSVSKHSLLRRFAPRPVFPFTAIVGQEEMKLALLLNVIDPTIGGVLIMGQRGTGKSTAVRAIADLLPAITRVRGCAFGCDPKNASSLCDECATTIANGGKLSREAAQVPVVDLPLGATEDRVCGTIDIEHAFKNGLKRFEPGLLAQANRGILYIDEVNLLEDHLIDLLLDVAVTGINRVEREGVSIEHPSRFVLVGSGNPEEGGIRPQLTDRFGLQVEVSTPKDLDDRVRVIERCESFARNPEKYRTTLEGEQEKLRRRLVRARRNLPKIDMPRSLLRLIAALCCELHIDGHRGELTITRAARALAAFDGHREISDSDAKRVAPMALRHRMRRDPLDAASSRARIERAIENVFESNSKTTAASGRNDRKPPEEGGSNPAVTNGSPRESPKGRGSSESRGREQEAGASIDSEIVMGAFERFMSPKTGRKKTPTGKSTVTGAKVTGATRGRYMRATATRGESRRVAVDSTIRSAALRNASQTPIETHGSESSPIARRLDFSDLRFKQMTRESGTLYIFAIDTSGSMALNRITQAKGAIHRLLRRAYVCRDRVAVVTFREKGAEVALPPTQRADRAARVLDSLRVGGSTPLAAGIRASIDLALRSSSDSSLQTVLCIFTDGCANVALRGNESSNRSPRDEDIDRELTALGRELARVRIPTLVVDTQSPFTSRGDADALALKIGGSCVGLRELRDSYVENDG